MKTVGRWVVAGVVVAGLASGWSRPAQATEARGGARAEPAVVAGGRTMGADELARAGRAVESPPALTIYQARLPDGTLELSDRPPAGAVSVERRSYGLAPQDASTQRRAQAEREYWRGQADAFAKRQRERERDADRAAREAAPTTTLVVAGWPRRAVVGPLHGWPPPDVAYPAVPLAGHGVSGAYTSSPGAVQGRSTGGFIGSGFATAR